MAIDMANPPSRAAGPTAPGGVASRAALLSAGIRIDDLPASAIESAKAAILDTIGVALAARTTPIARQIHAFVASQGGPSHSVVLGHDLQAPAAWAALANGTLAHALDYDDTYYGLRSSTIGHHPSSVLVPTALAVAEQHRRSGGSVIEGYVAGFEVGARLREAWQNADIDAGWHGTSTVGAVSAAVTASRIRELTPEETVNAIGIAASQSGGLRANFGTMTKPLHVGLAAKAGVIAADLAAGGWSAAADSIGARDGLDAQFGQGRLRSAGFAEQELALVSGGLAQKVIPACAATHRAIEAILELRARYELDSADVVSIDVGVEPFTPTFLRFPIPASPDEARFSMEFSLAVALLDGRAGLSQYSAARVEAADWRDLAGRIQVYVHSEMTGTSDWEGRFQQVDVHLADGRTVGARVHQPRGHPLRPLSREDLSMKFVEAASVALEVSRVHMSLEAVLGLERLTDIGDLTRVLRGHN